MHYFKIYLLIFKYEKDLGYKLMFNCVFHSYDAFFYTIRWSCLMREIQGLGGAEPPIKENAVGFIVPDEEEEWVVCIKFNGWEARFQTHLTPSASCSLCALLIYFHIGLVENIGQIQVSLCRHS